MTRCLAPDCQMGGLGCDNMTVILICNLNGQSYDKLAERCAITTHTVRSRSYSTGSSESSCSTSCSDIEKDASPEDTPELSDDVTYSLKFQKKADLNKKSSQQVNVSGVDEITEVKNSIENTSV